MSIFTERIFATRRGGFRRGRRVVVLLSDVILVLADDVHSADDVVLHLIARGSLVAVVQCCANASVVVVSCVDYGAERVGRAGAGDHKSEIPYPAIYRVLLSGRLYLDAMKCSREQLFHLVNLSYLPLLWCVQALPEMLL